MQEKYIIILIIFRKSSIRHTISVPAQGSQGQLVEKEILSKVKLSKEELIKRNAKGKSEYAYGMYFSILL